LNLRKKEWSLNYIIVISLNYYRHIHLLHIGQPHNFSISVSINHISNFFFITTSYLYGTSHTLRMLNQLSRRYRATPSRQKSYLSKQSRSSIACLSARRRSPKLSKFSKSKWSVFTINQARFHWIYRIHQPSLRQ